MEYNVIEEEEEEEEEEGEKERSQCLIERPSACLILF